MNVEVLIAHGWVLPWPSVTRCCGHKVPVFCDVGNVGRRFQAPHLWTRPLLLYLPMVGRQRRGPPRSADSMVKIRCAFKGCRNRKDVKNCGAGVQCTAEDVQREMCRRSLRAHAKVVRFCSQRHMDICTAAQPGRPRGQRAVFEAEQLVQFFLTCVDVGSPWLGVLVLLQTFCAERADCMRRACVGWLSGLDPTIGDPAMVHIPKVNGKTKTRSIPMPSSFAHLVHGWLQGPPLSGPPGTQWPFVGQAMDDGRFPLFPGHKGGPGSRRAWRTPVSERGYLARLRDVSRRLQRERAEAKTAGRPHAFDNVDLGRVGTHTFKRTGVTLLKDAGASSAVVAMIAGTTAKTLDKFYDAPAEKRQRAAVTGAFGALAGAVAAGGTAASSSNGGPTVVRFCSMCGRGRSEPSWVSCPWCGRVY